MGFVWWKKIERDLAEGVPLKEVVKAAAKRKRAAVEVVKEKKKHRSAANREGERIRAHQHDDQDDEIKFCVDQIAIRSKIRLIQGRPKPIDLLFFYHHLHIQDHDAQNHSHWDLFDDFDFDCTQPPYQVFKGLTAERLLELHDDITLLLNYFNRVSVPKDPNPNPNPNPIVVKYWDALLVLCKSQLNELHGGLHSSIAADVRNLLGSKMYEELLALQTSIDLLMHSGKAFVVEFWETVHRCLPMYLAKALLDQIHNNILKPRSPCRSLIHKEEIFTTRHEEAPEVNLISKGQDYSFTRKPKYFNLMRVGYEWNKYNRTHYDHDNPPPKMVQGYKFDIFYPDLLGESKVPDYSIEKDGDSSTTCIIRFHAGPPYDDIAFRIVNREWDYRQRKGFKCVFESGIFHLHFTFKRFPYRR